MSRIVRVIDTNVLEESATYNSKQTILLHRRLGRWEFPPQH